MARAYGPLAGKKVEKAVGEMKRGTLRSGSKDGPVVKDKRQAIAIGLSQAKKAGGKVPKKAKK